MMVAAQPVAVLINASRSVCHEASTHGYRTSVLPACVGKDSGSRAAELEMQVRSSGDLEGAHSVGANRISLKTLGLALGFASRDTQPPG